MLHYSEPDKKLTSRSRILSENNLLGENNKTQTFPEKLQALSHLVTKYKKTFDCIRSSLNDVTFSSVNVLSCRTCCNEVWHLSYILNLLCVFFSLVESRLALGSPTCSFVRLGVTMPKKENGC